ncbi:MULTISPECIES: hypothetical protein [Streptomyces]|uniref:hypothetical protein n=1 Tax=Streptomyces TaxID=1883 RepID=UPI000998901B|nr:MULTISPECIES: hypothetical protein [Streptomyces]
MTRCYADGEVHDFPVEDDTGAHCPEHGVTLLWRAAPPTDSRPAAHSLEGLRPGGRSPNSDRRSP